MKEGAPLQWWFGNHLVDVCAGWTADMYAAQPSVIKEVHELDKKAKKV